MNAEIIAKTLGKRIYQPPKVLLALMSFGITETALGKQLGVSQQQVGYWLRGEQVVADRWMPELYALLGEFIDSKQATIDILKRQGKWDQQTRKILNSRFRKAEKIFNSRPAEYRTDQDVA